VRGKNNCTTETVFQVAFRGRLLTLLVLLICANAVCFAQKGQGQKMGLARHGYQPKIKPVKPKNRDESLRALMTYLGLGEGAVVADIGAGSGRDAWVFAKIVGNTGKVFAEEIISNKVKSLQSEAVTWTTT
jgi:hypothetical protein